GSGGRNVVLARADEQPVHLPAVLVGPHADKRPDAFQAAAVEPEGEPALRQALPGIALGDPRAPVPDLDRAGAVVSFRDDPLEMPVLEGVVLDLDGETLVARFETRPLRNRPAAEHAVELQPEIVVQPPGRVLLDEESQRLDA